MNDANPTTGQVTNSAAEVYEDFFVPALFAQWTGPMLDAAGVSLGDDVLDVGCGTGVLTRAAIGLLGDTGSVTGVDSNEGMLVVARRASGDVTWREAPAEALPFEKQSFDRVVSQFAAMFFTDKQAALQEMARVTRPGGSITVATWASVEQSPGYAAMVDLLRRIVGDDAGDALLAPFSIGTPLQLQDLMGGILPDVCVTQHDGFARFDSLEDWIHTDVRGWTLSDMISDSEEAELLAAASSELAAFVDVDGRVSFPAPALIAHARR